jgi:hypothetical protein
VNDPGRALSQTLELAGLEPEARALEVGRDRDRAVEPWRRRPHQLLEGRAQARSRLRLVPGADQREDPPVVALQDPREQLAAEKAGGSAEHDPLTIV